jgi:broad specificity phosphatase PhoE
MPTELLLIRHGESEGNVGLPCDADCALTPTGRQQARRVARQLLEHDLRGFVGLTSPYRRAILTAGEIAAATGMAFAVDEDMREYAGEAMVNGKLYPRETGAQLIARVTDFVRRQSGRKLVVVSHAAPLAVLIQLATGQPPDTTGEFWAGLENCCLRRLKTTD